MNRQDIPAVDPKEFWPLMGVRAIGGAVVAATGAQGPAGFLALSVAHLTATPPTLVVSVGKPTSALATLLEAGSFAVNYLSTDHKPLADVFGGRTAAKGADRFSTGQWGTLITGAPVLSDAVGVIDCVIEETIERHETLIVLGRIVGYAADNDAPPLVYYKGGILPVQGS
ncbi:MAG: flavin reductase [Confluentimicrobium sp.]|jgi:flavin reductase (DIM6/NTAB) family NADH-FMN oxidoreductase RutF|uniref:flavin reductase family protein n=1 Tax=Actibacterium sp. TaxID=1872125 RepID=UPI000C5B34D0|nr:flavin reductase family protein [Actibacterium sp.]MBC57182.1 flavin reductase [Actibacterium sp.]